MRKITINEDKEHFNKGIFHSSETETLSSDITKCLADAAENTNQTPSHHDRQPPSLQVGLGHLFLFILILMFVCFSSCTCPSVEETLFQSARRL